MFQTLIPYNINAFNNVVPLMVVNNNVIMQVFVGTIKATLLILYMIYVVFAIAFNEVAEYAMNTYVYLFGDNHTSALIIAATAAIVTLMFFDKLLSIEINMTLYKSQEKRISELEEQIFTLKAKQAQQTEDMTMIYKSLSKDIEIVQIAIDTKTHSLTKQVKKLEKNINQYI
jgi:hypothetical protein